MKKNIERLKQSIRLIEAALTPARRRVTLRGRPFTIVRSLWWEEHDSAVREAEIEVYFEAMSRARPYRALIDAGAEVGLFAIAAAAEFPGSRIHAFEPSRRQRILLRRNLRLSGTAASQIRVTAAGLWNRDGQLAFHTHGAISAALPAGEHLAGQVFAERVAVVTLDAWRRGAGVDAIDLIKMDIEGAEIEALEGARDTLMRDRPELLVQAYHERGGRRTLERCEAFLEGLGYTCREASPGLLCATARTLVAANKACPTTCSPPPRCRPIA